MDKSDAIAYGIFGVCIALYFRALILWNRVSPQIAHEIVDLFV
jgi:hypothetical protein